MSAFPTSIPSIPRITSPLTQHMDDPGFEIDLLHNQIAGEIEALASAVGVTGSTVVGTVENRLAYTSDILTAHVGAAAPHSGHLTSSNLSQAAGVANLLTTNTLLRAKCDVAKKGYLGVGPNKGVIALRFDDWQNALRTTVVPLLQARGLPFSHALISGFSTEQPWGVGTTWADIKGWVARGCEIWCHGWDHKDYLGYNGLVRNVVTAKQEIEAQNLKVQGFSVPGVTPVYTNEQRGSSNPYDSQILLEDLMSPTGHLILQNYPLMEGYGGGTYGSIGNGHYYGRGHATIDAVSLATAKSWIDDSIKYRLSIRIMCHAGNIGTQGYMSLSDYTAWLDYLVSFWDAGQLEVVTPSALPYVDTTTNRLDLLSGDGAFLGLSQGTPGVWNNLGGAYNTVYQTGGYNNGPYIQIPSTGGSGPNARPPYLSKRGLNGETFLFEGWCKSLGAGNTTARVIIRGYTDSSQFNLDLTKSVGSSSWTRWRVPFTIPVNDPSGNPQDYILIQPHRNGGDDCGWSNISVMKV